MKFLSLLVLLPTLLVTLLGGILIQSGGTPNTESGRFVMQTSEDVSRYEVIELPPQVSADKPSDAQNTPIVWGSASTCGDVALIDFCGKTVRAPLYDALSDNSCSADKFAIGVVFMRSNDADFVYNGKTLAQYDAEYEAELALREKLEKLIKDGDALKYGEDLYKTGTPDGVKWAQSYYESTIRYYGKDLLAEYIVDGVFLREKVERALDDLKTEGKASALLDEACDAYELEKAVLMYKSLSQNNVPCEMVGKTLFFYATAEQFLDLRLSDIGLVKEDAQFTLAVKDELGRPALAMVGDLNMND